MESITTNPQISIAHQHPRQIPLSPGKISLRILPAEAAIQTMKAATPRPDHVSANFWRAGEHPNEMLAAHLTSYLQREDPRPAENLQNNPLS
ncbi:unnamed protein product [Strongylus vulgaris]|uniref:Uncharacterized protein n=1 Tax=Strongylus vulgaris TaxID=40348 RepID=A0A3P7IXP8_STRVU|nr:unnamed protein product [Strongylus vulgaris]